MNLPIKVLPILESLEYILDNQSSLVRFGDGEVDLMTGKSIAYQTYQPKLAKRLLDILKIPSRPDLLVTLPDVFTNIDRYNQNAQIFWKHHFNEQEHFYIKNCQSDFYGSTFVSRPYIDLVDKSQSKLYFEKIRQLWQDKDILIVEGQTSRSGVGNDLFDNAKSLKRIICPSKNAFGYYQQILSSTKSHCQGRLVLLMLGPTAKLLAYDLQLSGQRALDLGHIDSEYEWFKMGAKHKVKLTNKHTAEHNWDQDIQESHDQLDHAQIIDTVGIMNTPKKLISIIIPVYNVKPYLQRCLDTVLKQTYQYLDIILINDGSSDGSAAICLDYAKKDARIRLYHQENKGVSAARNFGLEVARGDYVTFIDADDFVEDNYVQALYSAAISNQSDISVCNFSSFNEERQSYLFFLKPEDKFTKTYNIQEWLDQETIARYNMYLVFTFSPMKLFKRDLFSDIRFPIGRTREDDATIYKLYLKSNQVTFINQGLYFYSQRQESLSHTVMTDDIEHMIRNAEERIALLASLGYDISKHISSYLARLEKCQKDALKKGQMALYQDISSKLDLYKHHQKGDQDGNR